MAPPRTLQIPALAMRAAASSVNAEKRTVSVVWTTGARVMRGFYDRFWEELSLERGHVRMDRLNSGAPFLANHDGSDVSRTLGVVESATHDGKQGTAVIRFASEGVDPEADKVFRKIADGIIKNVSVGYRIHKMEKVEDGADKIPVYRATDWEPMEISAVSIGADAGAGFRSEQPFNTCVFQTRENESMKTPEEIAAEKVAEEKRAADLKAEGERAARVERERASGIQHACRVLGADASEKASKWIADGTALDTVRAAVIEEMATRSDSIKTENHVRVEITDDVKDKRFRGLSAALLHRAGFVPTIREAIKKGGDAAERLAGTEIDPGEFRGISLMNVCRELLEGRGIRTTRMSNTKLFETAVLQRAGYQSSSEFGVLFENVMYKALLSAFAIQGDTWRMFCGTDKVVDFRDANRFRTGSLDVLDALAENGEYQNKAIPDGAKQTINTATKGNIYALSRQTFIADDMGALADIFGKMGRAAARTIEEDVYALINANSGLGEDLADSNPFFHTSRANINSTGSPLAVAGLDADRVVMLGQKDDEDREYLDLRPHTLLVPVGLGGLARQVNDMQFDGVSNKFQVPNMVRGLFKNIVESPRITGTRRYLFADPSQHPAIKVVFLEESGEAPLLESEDGWRVDGVEYKVRIDAKAQFFEPKAAVTNAGT